MEKKEISWFKALRELRKLVKKFEKNPKLREHFDMWLEREYDTSNEEEFLQMIRGNPSIIKEVVSHYESVKGEF